VDQVKVVLAVDICTIKYQANQTQYKSSFKLEQRCLQT